MAKLQPYGKLYLASQRDLYGAVDYQADSLSWTLPDMLGTNGVRSVGFVKDPTETYLIQEPRYIPVDGDETLWTAATGKTATFSHGQDVQTGKKSLRQTNGVADVTGDVLFKGARFAEVGFFLRLFRGSNVAGNANTDGSPAADLSAATWNHYVYFSALPGDIAGAPMGSARSADSNTPRLRLAIEAGSPIRLDVSTDGWQTWSTADTAAELGESEAYLRKARHLDIDVCPLTDASWYGALPYSAQNCAAPPNLVAVTLNGGAAVLVWRAEQATLAAGAVRLAGQGGQWEAKYWKRRYAPSSLLVLPPQARPVPFASEAEGRISGYAPAQDWGEVVGTLTDVNKAYATLTVAATGANLDASNPSVPVAFQTVVLSAVHLHFPAIQVSGQSPSFLILDAYEWFDEHRFHQQDFLGRASGKVIFSDPTGQFAPGGVIPLAVMAAILVRGLRDPAIGYDDGQVAITGLTSLGDDDIEWYWIDGKFYFGISITDRFRDNVPCRWMLPFDGQCQYYCMRELAHRLGVTDDWLDFPICERDSPCDHYHLPVGTTNQPLYRFPPNETIMEAMLQIRAESGAYDFQTGVVQPMYLYFNHQGRLQFFPAPVGLVQTWLNPNLTPISQGISLQKVFSVVPQFSGGLPVLNEFTRNGKMGSRASLKNIRTEIVLQGIRPSDGAFLDGWFTNPALETSSTQPGSVGLSIAYINTSKRFSSTAAITISLQAAAVQMSFPSISTTFTAWFQSSLFALAPIGVLEPNTQGTHQVVPYYTTYVGNHGKVGTRLTEPIAESTVEARLLGQAD